MIRQHWTVESRDLRVHLGQLQGETTLVYSVCLLCLSMLTDNHSHRKKQFKLANSLNVCLWTVGEIQRTELEGHTKKASEKPLALRGSNLLEVTNAIHCSSCSLLQKQICDIHLDRQAHRPG